MQEVFEKIKERLRTEKAELTTWAEDMAFELGIDKAIEIVNQVAEEYQSTVGQVKCDASFSDGYIKGIDDAIEKFLEYGCFCIEWNPKLSKERLVDDVLRQVKGQSVYILEKLKQKAEEYNQSLTNSGWIPCSERLPEDNEIHECTVLFNTGMRYIEYAYYDMAREEWWTHDDTGLVNVIAWKPSPQPYRGE